VEDYLVAASEAEGGKDASGSFGEADGGAVEGDAEEGHCFFCGFGLFNRTRLGVDVGGCEFCLGGGRDRPTGVLDCSSYKEAPVGRMGVYLASFQLVAAKFLDIV